MNNNQNTVSNPETQVPKTPAMNDADYLNDFLMTEKAIDNNYAIAMNEASNNKLYEQIGTLCRDTKNLTRELFNLQFKKGWYRLEQAEQQKIDQVFQEYQKKTNEL